MLRVITSLVVVTIYLSSASTMAAGVQKTLHVSPSGSDKNPGTMAEPFKTIQRARDEVRKVNKKMTGNVEVILHDGTYKLSETVVFDHRDGGTGGHNVVYKAAAGATPVLSGGRVITGWKADAKGRWRVDCGEHFRQLYVDGKRAVRARSSGASVPGMELFGENGYRTSDVSMADWRNPGDIEFCYHIIWCHTRCKVESIVRNGPHVVVRMVQPQFMFARRKEGVHVGLPRYLENALELLDEPGEWYLDRADKVLYYKPLPGQKINEVKVIAPLLEKLVELRGLLNEPVRHIQFHGITFAHATWLRPSRIGLVDMQANFVVHSLNNVGRMGTLTNVHNEYVKSPANVVCRTGKHVHFERCTFVHLGGAGIDLEYGSSDNIISGCRFHDISGTAIQVGGIQRDDHHPGDKRTTVRNNKVLNNLIENCAAEYKGGLGVFAGYTDGTVIAHNEIRNMPYSGISVGWGWGEEDAGGGRVAYYQPFKFDTPTPAKNNLIEYNHIHHVMSSLRDGGGIYMLGNMPGTVIRGNHVHDGHGAGIYLDEGSGFIEITGNLAYNVNRPMLFNNIHKHPKVRRETCDEHDNWFGNEYARDAENLPEGAKKVIGEAGLQPQYRDLLNKQEVLLDESCR